MSKVGENIARLRKANGMTQEELAKMMGYKSKSTINKIELGISDISQSNVVRFAEILKTTPAIIMGWSDDLTEGRAEQNRTEDDARLLDLFHALNETQRKNVLTLLESMV